MKPTFRRSVALAVLVLAAALFCSLSGLAQQTLGSINGTVMDPSGAAIPGASVTANNAAINVTASATTSSSGSFQIFNLPIGTYVVKITRDGFEVSEFTAIAVQEARATTVNATLKIGQTSESVTVSATRRRSPLPHLRPGASPRWPF
jgi:hypothetical protein